MLNEQPIVESDVTTVTDVQAQVSADNPVTAVADDVTESRIPTEQERPRYVVFDDWHEEGGRKYRAGVWYFSITKGTERNPSVPIEQWICSPLHVEAITFDGQGNNFGRYLHFINTNKQSREWAMPMEMLRGSGEDLRGELLSMGVEIDPQARNQLSTYLQSQHPKRRMRCATQVGWCEGSFVLPDTVIGAKASGVIFQSGERTNDEYTTTGNLAGWQKEIAAHAVTNPLLAVTLSAAFAGALLERCNTESGGLHYVGDSSSGKTGLIEAACSVWGGENYKRSWRSTSNGMEGVAAMFNDGLLALDEISECDPRDVGAIVYSLGNGKGKQRASRTGSARSVKRWRCFVLSSGERSIETTMAEGGHRMKAGQNTRLPSVPVARRYGVWDDLGTAESGATLTDAIKRAAKQHYGYAGREFLECLTRDARDWCAHIERIKALPEFTIAGGEGQAKRVAGRFALVAMAGELSTEYGITGWQQGTATYAAADVLKAWLKTCDGAGNNESRQILEKVAAFIERHGDSRFSSADVDANTPIRDRAGWWRDDYGHRTYLFTAEGMRETLKGFDFKRALDDLQHVGALPAPQKKGERAKPERIGGRLMKLYAINTEKLGSHHES
jgi:putative DNA primase/helicase